MKNISNESTKYKLISHFITFIYIFYIGEKLETYRKMVVFILFYNLCFIFQKSENNEKWLFFIKLYDFLQDKKL